MSVTISFFEMLSKCMNKENNLSDITHSLIEVSDSFREFFLKFIVGSKQTCYNKYKELYREFALSEDSRPDFFFIFDNKVILLENKIWDKDYHFDKYTSALNSYLGSNLNITQIKVLISAHKLSKKDEDYGTKYDFKIIYWDCFANELNKNISAFMNEKELIEGYIKYIEGVIKVPEIGRINFSNDNLKSIFYLGNLIETIIKQNKSSSSFDYEIDNQNKRSKDNFSTGYGYVINKNGAIAASLNFYLLYVYNGSPAIIIDLPLDWNRTLNQSITIVEGQYFNFEEATKVEGCAFILKKELYNKFLDVNQEEQKNILTEFYLEVNNIIEDLITKTTYIVGIMSHSP